ncbi:MAG: hypothetical protein BWX48_01751 [Verrucomicrobia bacterium ADurb.Bin006]|nr:MAG: hypothetical protein BWX48_01751 [Verrucomicrobia bacterium ADurb.Bin006]
MFFRAFLVWCAIAVTEASTPFSDFAGATAGSATTGSGGWFVLTCVGFSALSFLKRTAPPQRA